MTADADLDGAQVVLACDGSVWQPITGSAAAPDRGIQFNSGNALTALPDFIFTTDGHLGLGTPYPWSRLHVSGEDEDTTLVVSNDNSTADRWPGIDIRNYSGAGDGHPALSLFRARGSVDTPGAVQAWDTLGVLNFRGLPSAADPWSWGIGASVGAHAAEDWDETSMATNLEFGTTPPGHTWPVARMTITNVGRVGIGTEDPASALHVNGGIAVGQDPAACSAYKDGTLRYNSTGAPRWEYCDGGAGSWRPFEHAAAGTCYQSARLAHGSEEWMAYTHDIHVGVVQGQTYIFTATTSTWGVNEPDVQAHTFNGNDLALAASFALPNDGGTRRGARVWSDGTYVYVADTGTRIYALSFNGTAFAHISTYNAGAFINDIWGDGSHIYLALGTTGVRAMGFNGTSWTAINTYNTPGTAMQLNGHDGYIFVTDGSSGLRALTFNGATFTSAGTRTGIGTVNKFAVNAQGQIVLGTSNWDIRIYTFNGTSFPHVFTTTGYDIFEDTSLLFEGDYIYVGDGNDGVELLHYTGTALNPLSSFIGGGGIRPDGSGLATSGNYLYALGGFGPVSVFSLCSGGSLSGGDGSGLPNCSDDTPNQCVLQSTRADGDPEFLAANIASGVNVLGVTGTFSAFACSPGSQNFTAPGVHELVIGAERAGCAFEITVKGGGGGRGGGTGRRGGDGGGTVLRYVPGSVGSFDILVGGGGAGRTNNASQASGGAGGGGNGRYNGGAGGGASAVLFNDELLAVAGGGGGAGRGYCNGANDGNGGNGGGLNDAGADVTPVGNDCVPEERTAIAFGGHANTGGAGGATSEGWSGAGGDGGSSGGSGSNGENSGGNGGLGEPTFLISGGGGSGYDGFADAGGGGGGGYGGGGGGHGSPASGGGGGGGYLNTALVEPGATLVAGGEGSSAGNGANGSIEITWFAPSGSGTCAAPADCPNVGDVCADGSLFAGFMADPAGGSCRIIHVTDSDQSSTSTQWKNAIGTNDISTDDHVDGQVNHANRGGALSDFPAFDLCEANSYHGKSDWYLPARAELNLLWLNRAAINANAAGSFASNDFWSSTEHNMGGAWYQDFGAAGGGQYNALKTDSDFAVRCVRSVSGQ